MGRRQFFISVMGSRKMTGPDAIQDCSGDLWGIHTGMLGWAQLGSKEPSRRGGGCGRERCWWSESGRLGRQRQESSALVI